MAVNAILNANKSLYLGTGLTDCQEIWHDDNIVPMNVLCNTADSLQYRLHAYTPTAVAKKEKGEGKWRDGKWESLRMGSTEKMGGGRKSGGEGRVGEGEG